MNPECDFDWYLLSGKGDCKLAYSKDYFRTKPNYEAYYKDIKKLFTTGNRYIAGFAVSNDVGFVNNANERYDLPYIQFRAFDLERYLERKYEKKQKLGEWAQEFGVNLEKFMSHKSVDDAMMTMLCLKAECARTGQSVEDIFNSPEGKTCFVSNEQILEQAAERAYRREVTEKIKRLYNKKSPMPRFKTVSGCRFELDRRIMHDVDQAFELVKRIYENGGMVCERITGRVPDGEKGFAVFEKVPDNQYVLKKLHDRSIEAMSLEELESKLR